MIETTEHYRMLLICSSCQCGISRSATLVIAIVMRFAAEGKMPEILSGVRGMHDAYEFVKGKSPIIGPNVSCVSHSLRGSGSRESSSHSVSSMVHLYPA